MSNIRRTRIVETTILSVRGHKVILDRHLALLYGVETRALNQAVTRNRERFPRDFMFALTRDEITRISQSVTSSADLSRPAHRPARAAAVAAVRRRVPVRFFLSGHGKWAIRETEEPMR